MSLSSVGLGLIGEAADEAGTVVMVLLVLQFFAALHLLGYRLVLRVPREQQAGFFTFYAIQVAGFIAAALGVVAILLADGLVEMDVEILGIFGLGAAYLLAVHYTSRKMMSLNGWQAAKAMPFILLVSLSMQALMWMDL